MLLDELGDVVALGAVAIGHGAEPIHLSRSILHFLARQRSIISSDLGDKDRVLIDLSGTSTAHITRH